MKQKRKCIRYSEVLEEVGDVFLIVSTISFLQVKLDFLQRKYNWMLEHEHSYRNHLSELISVLEIMRTDLESKLKTNESTDEFLCQIGSNMQKMRKEKNITLKEMSARSYFNEEELETIEKGQYHFTDLNDLDHIAKLLNCSLCILFGN